MKKLTISLLFLAFAGFTACSDNVCEQSEVAMVKIQSANGNFLIDAYEASRSNATADTEGTGVTLACNYRGTVPWGNVTYEDARNACLDSGKRLCTKAEWMEACGSQAYPYGSSYASGTCTDTSAAEPSLTGSKSGCKSPSAVFDMSGNVREWVEGGILMGGAYNSASDEVKCSSAQTQANYMSYVHNRGDGFRCCQDESIAQE